MRSPAFRPVLLYTVPCCGAHSWSVTFHVKQAFRGVGTGCVLLHGASRMITSRAIWPGVITFEKFLEVHFAAVPLSPTRTVSGYLLSCGRLNCTQARVLLCSLRKQQGSVGPQLTQYALGMLSLRQFLRGGYSCNGLSVRVKRQGRRGGHGARYSMPLFDDSFSARVFIRVWCGPVLLVRTSMRSAWRFVDDELLADPASSPSSSSGGDVKDLSVKGAAPSARRVPLAEDEDEGSGLQLTTTTEFCRSIQTPLEKIQTMKQEVFTGSRLFR